MTPTRLAALALLLSAPALPAAPRNVVLFVTDDQGLDAGCYGHPVVKTPHLDRLAAEGTRFTHAFCTTASCSPSRSVLLTGRHGHATGQYGLQHADHHFSAKDNVVSLPALLGKAGYRTARAGKFHVGPDAVYPFDKTVAGNPRNGVALADACKEFLAEKSEKPFFLYFCTADPHRDGGKKGEPAAPNRFGNQAYPGVTAVEYDPKDVVVPPFLPDTPPVRAELAEYYQSVSRADQGLGRLRKVLEEAGHADDTMIVYVSDNGIPFPGAKTTVYDAGTRLPCVVRHPAAEKRGVVSGAMVSWADVTPTLLDFAGALPKDSASFHGRSFLPVLGKESPAGWDEVLMSHTFHEVTMYYPMRAIRTRTHKLILNLAHPLEFPFASDLWGSATWQDTLKREAKTYGKRDVKAFVNRPKEELYDLAKDPDEAVNLAGKEESAAVLADLRKRLRAWQERTGDPWVVKYTHE